MKVVLVFLIFIQCLEGIPLEGVFKTKNERGLAESQNDIAKPDVVDDTAVEVTEIYNRKKIETSSEDVRAQAKNCVRVSTNVDVGIYTSNTMIGGTGDERKYINGDGEKKGRIVRSIKFLKYANLHFKRLEVELSDGSSHTCGNTGSDTSESERLYLSTNERITEFKLWNNDKCGKEERITGILIRTSRGQLFQFYADRKGEPYQPPIGSGVLVGFQAECGVDIDGLGPLLLQKAESSIVSDVTYPDIEKLAISSKPIHINTMTYDNKKGSTEQEYILSGSKAVSETASWSFSSSLEWSYSQEVKVKAAWCYVQVEWGSKFSIKSGISYTHSSKVTTTNTRSYSFKVKVPPHKAVMAVATTYEGVINTRYIGTLTFHLVTGRTFGYTIEGMYNGISSTQVIVSTKNI